MGSERGRDMSEEHAVAVMPKKTDIALGPRGLELQSLGHMLRYADMCLSAGVVPKGVNQAAVVIAIEYGASVGLSAAMSVQSIAVINGRPSIFGDAVPALCSDILQDKREWYTGEEFTDDWTAHCELHRVGRSQPCVQSFSWAEAKRAGLDKKSGPWTQYPKRMLMWRARMWAYRDEFPDRLQGMASVEESRDIEATARLASQPTDEAAPMLGAAPEPPAEEAEIVEANNDEPVPAPTEAPKPKRRRRKKPDTVPAPPEEAAKEAPPTPEPVPATRAPKAPSLTNGKTGAKRTAPREIPPAPPPPTDDSWTRAEADRAEAGVANPLLADIKAMLQPLGMSEDDLRQTIEDMDGDLEAVFADLSAQLAEKSGDNAEAEGGPQ